MPPLLPEVGVLALVPERFDAPWMSRHQILTRLARYYRVVWLNPAEGWRETWGRALGGGAERRPAAATGVSRDGFEVVEPPLFAPRFHRPAWLERATDAARLAHARRRLTARGCDRIVLHVWRPVFWQALDRVAHDASLYHVVDEYSFADDAAPIAPEERALLERADRVIIHSPGLLEKKGGLNPHTESVPNGVDFASVSAEHPEPADLARVPHPRIGYCGWLKHHLDWPLIEALAERHPAWSFVFVGGRSPHPELDPVLARLEARPNVHLLGLKPTHELVRYPRHFDACIMPYRITAYTDCIYPLKLHEYFATGRPVVATPIRSLRDFEGRLALASDEPGWSAALEDALAHPERGAADRIATAKAHDWSVLARRVAEVIADGLGPEVRARLDACAVEGPDGPAPA